MKALTLIILIALAGMITPAIAWESGSSNLTYLGAVPLNTYHNHINDGVLYAQEGFTVRIYDLSSDLSEIKYTSYVDQIIFTSNVAAITSDNGNLYVLGGGHLSVFDLTDKLHPGYLGHTTASGGDLIAAGDYVFVGGSDLNVYDVSNPSKPFLINVTATPTISDLAFDGRYLYGGYYDSGGTSTFRFITIDASDPSQPVYLGSTTTAGATSGLAYYNDTLYVSSFGKSFQAWDVANRSAPVQFWNSASLAANHIGAVDLRVDDHYLFVDARYNSDTNIGLGNGGVVVYDISNNTPVKLDADGTGFLGYTEDLSTDGNVLVTSSNTLGMNLYDVSNKSNIVRRAHIGVPSTPYVLNPTTLGKIDVLGHAGRDGGSWYWNITDPAAPSLLASWEEVPLARMNQNMPWFKNNSYVCYGSNGVGCWVLNLTGLEDPSFKTPLGIPYSQNNYMASQIVSEKRIYETTKSSTLKIWTNSEKPVLLNASPLLSNYDEMAFYHGNFIIADHGSELRVLDITTDSPVLAANFTYNKTITGWHYDPAVDRVYVTDTGYNLRAVNVSDTNSIHWEPGYRDMIMQTRAVTSNGNDVFVVGRDVYGSGTIRMVSFENTSAPKVIDHAHSIYGDDQTVAYYKGYVYAGAPGALTVYKIIPTSGLSPIEPTPEQTPIVIAPDPITQKDRCYLTINIRVKCDGESCKTSELFNWTFRVAAVECGEAS